MWDDMGRQLLIAAFCVILTSALQGRGNSMVNCKENRKLVTIRLEEIFYYLFFGIMFAAKGVGLDRGSRLFTLCMMMSLCCLAVKLCLSKHTLKEWFVMISLVMMGGVIYRNSGEESAFWAMLVIIGMKNISLKRLMSVCAGIWSVTFAFSVTAGILRIRDGVVVVHDKLGLGPIIRWSLGYTHPNVFHVSYFILAALLIYVFGWHGKKLWKASTLLFIGNLLVFLYSISYTGILIVTGYLILNIYLDYRKKLYLPECILFTAAAGFLILFPIVGPLWLEGHKHSLFMFFNELLSYRFELVYNIFHENPVSLFGTDTVYTGNGHVTLDSSFAYLLMYYGTAGFVLFVAGFLYLVYCFGRTNRKKELAITLTIIVAGVTEQFLFNLSFKNLLFFFLGEALFADILKTDGKKGFWNRRFAVLPFGERRICITVPSGLHAGVYQIKENGKRIMLAGVVMAVIGAGVRAVTVETPNSVYVYRWHTDYRGDDKVTLDMDNLSEDFNSLVLGYNGPDAEMFEFTGNIVTVEQIRTPVGGAVLGCMAGMILMAIFYMGRGWHESINHQ